MSDNSKIQDTHLQRSAYVYIRQSSAAQVLINRESTDLQYQLHERAVQLGWSKTQVKVIDEDLAHSASGVVTRHGFAQMTHEVAMGQVGADAVTLAQVNALTVADGYSVTQADHITVSNIADLTLADGYSTTYADTFAIIGAIGRPVRNRYDSAGRRDDTTHGRSRADTLRKAQDDIHGTDTDTLSRRSDKL